ncbi:hypothetical protein RRF57_001451 [Xylaria bambusicola]|uniref:Uncharacterized protein n=1 Tax=Xylaria bambusicola TaxID=326684 RepID=A0AAN7U5H7_9PEZI
MHVGGSVVNITLEDRRPGREATIPVVFDSKFWRLDVATHMALYVVSSTTFVSALAGSID